MSGSAKRKSGLTANAVKHAKPRSKPYKLSDRDGLYLLVTPTGTFADTQSQIANAW